MRHLVILNKVRVENANCVAGSTYGFPAITHFLGYIHALSRRLNDPNLSFQDCGVICHQQQIHSDTPSYISDLHFSQTRNPLTKEAKSAAINEEGRMHMTVSLLFYCHGDVVNGQIGRQELQETLLQLAPLLPLAGGRIDQIEQVKVRPIPASEVEWREVRRLLLPGFALIDRTHYLAEHVRVLQQTDPDADTLQAWLDFSALKYHAITAPQQQPATWRYSPKPQPGYLVPLMVGWQRISPLYPAGTVAKTRDAISPFCFVEAAYGLGEWCGPHRIRDLTQLLWQYHITEQGYYCRSQFDLNPAQHSPQDLPIDDDML